MPLVLSDSGILKRLTGIVAELGSTCQLGLFAHNVIPAKTDVAGDYTAFEASFAGAARKTLTVWTTPAVIAHVAKSDAGLQTFMRTGGAVEDIYGYFVLDEDDELLWAESFPGGPVHMAGSGQTLGVIPVITDESTYG